MDTETEDEKERLRLWRERFELDDLEHKVTIGKNTRLYTNYVTHHVGL